MIETTFEEVDQIFKNLARKRTPLNLTQTLQKLVDLSGIGNEVEIYAKENAGHYGTCSGTIIEIPVSLSKFWGGEQFTEKQQISSLAHELGHANAYLNNPSQYYSEEYAEAYKAEIISKLYA